MSGPSRARLVAFLRGGALRPDGTVLSWVNPAHPGYPYPEAAALVLAALSQHAPESRAERERIAARLWAERGPFGGFGREGFEYTFDTAVVLRALASHAQASPPPERERWRARAAELVPPLRRALAAASPFLDPEQPTDAHWSRASGGHLLKCFLALRAWHALRDGASEKAAEPEEELEARLLERWLALESAGRWRESAHSQRAYVHAQAYALEGLVALAGRSAALGAVLLRGVERLARLQRSSGALSAWDGGADEADERSDATAQAVRLWLCVDARRFAAPIARARAYLARVQAEEGGIAYALGSADVNSWCSAFALQAEAWSERGAGSPAELF